VKNITVSLDDETYRRARVKAAEMDTSVSALVKQFLSDLAAGESEFERLKKMERALRERVTAFRAAGRLPRDAAHEPPRGRGR
jgi:plasmid stability protein